MIESIKDNLKYYLITTYQLFVYLVTGVIPLIILAPFVYLILGKRRAFKFAIGVDILTCVLAHGEFRTLSGLSGDRIKDRRYTYQANFIDFLFKYIDGKNHSVRQHLLEVDIKYNYYEFYKD